MSDTTAPARFQPDTAGGYNYQFIKVPLGIFVCDICHLPSKDPYLTVCCGHLFCKTCLDGAKNNCCPMCREEECVTFPNKQIDREIKGLMVYCTNQDKGCNWEGEVSNIDSHLSSDEGCQFEDVACPLECGKIMMRQFIADHEVSQCPRRKVDCHYCCINGEHQFIEGKHKDECPKFPLSCPNQCNSDHVLREDISNHRSKCPLEMIDCEFSTVGCKAKMPRKEQDDHNKENTEKHLIMTRQKLDDTAMELTTVKNQHAQRLATVETLLCHLSRGEDLLPSLISVESTQWGIHLELAAKLSQSGNQIAPVVFKVKDFSYKKSRKLQWYSDPFYTHKEGYKMCLCVDPADDNGNCCSWYLHLMKGQYDDELKWPLSGVFCVKFLNQISDNEHIQQSIGFDDDENANGTYRLTDRERSKCGWGPVELITHDKLAKVTPTCQYLKKDSLFFKVSQL
ncbi:TNF receptor-associated factor 4-like [Dysidea avara]|uniref:TNF receptor-associated factor 4-like n=1 Tax=Dysidea avara TaxID=196820 RepID=UPI0033200DF2